MATTVALSRRERRTLAAVTRVLVPEGTAVGPSADDVGLVEKVTAEVEGYPPIARRRIRLLLLAIEFLPLVDGPRRRPFSALEPKQQRQVLSRTGRHRRSALRRLVVSYLKQLVYAAYIAQPEVEQAIGYTYACLRPRAGIEAGPQEQIHH